MQSTKNKSKLEDAHKVQDTNPPQSANQVHAQGCICQHFNVEGLIELLIRTMYGTRVARQNHMEHAKIKNLSDMIMDANILACVSMAAAQGVIALYQEQTGELDAISEGAVAGLQHSLNMVKEAILKMEVYA